MILRSSFLTLSLLFFCSFLLPDGSSIDINALEAAAATQSSKNTGADNQENTVTNMTTGSEEVSEVASQQTPADTSNSSGDTSNSGGGISTAAVAGMAFAGLAMLGGAYLLWQKIKTVRKATADTKAQIAVQDSISALRKLGDPSSAKLQAHIQHFKDLVAEKDALQKEFDKPDSEKEEKDAKPRPTQANLDAQDQKIAMTLQLTAEAINTDSQYENNPETKNLLTNTSNMTDTYLKKLNKNKKALLKQTITNDLANQEEIISQEQANKQTTSPTNQPQKSQDVEDQEAEEDKTQALAEDEAKAGEDSTKGSKDTSNTLTDLETQSDQAKPASASENHAEDTSDRENSNQKQATNGDTETEKPVASKGKTLKEKLKSTFENTKKTIKSKLPTIRREHK